MLAHILHLQLDPLTKVHYPHPYYRVACPQLKKQQIQVKPRLDTANKIAHLIDASRSFVFECFKAGYESGLGAGLGMGLGLGLGLGVRLALSVEEYWL